MASAGRVEFGGAIDQALASGVEALARADFGFDPLARLQVVESVFNGFFDHLLDFLIAHIHGRLYFHDGLLPGLDVASQYLQDAVGVDLELDTDARDPLGRRRKLNGEAPQAPVVFGALALALKHVDEHAALLVHRGREHFPGLDRDGGIAGDDDVHQAAERLQAEGEGRDIEQQDILESPG